ncbi:B-box-type zinc finger,Zinc finger, RING/FYVE/PHD-type,Bromodomain,Zinc finger, PHD-type [Cinara cedri]|uniref:B-box-type zinc finger,Zinc finger, RING/FYVE/PHD-type,Bromodomain,Zinc finger, PHD-type n=1 Tax=Cinara cedri TaxID=506608 RepID=A0A5E4N892_9HEMI|nr:B-box-type zinc finger,Zinc finger, RING/FYVE/PHD-type,Bromodomain,Zinc finger, PHD-type [Cinara cedri]
MIQTPKTSIQHTPKKNKLEEQLNIQKENINTMVSEVQKVEVPIKNEESKLWSKHTCIFCNVLLDGRSKILACLHVICFDCVDKYTINSSVQCKCLEVTKDKLIDYPIIPGAIKGKCCGVICDAVVTKMCISCNSLYCKKCSKAHLGTEENHILVNYPLKREFNYCANCKKKRTEVYCTNCSTMLCSLCHLQNHQKHNYEVIENLCKEIKFNFARQENELEINNLVMDYCLQQTDNQIKTIESLKNVIIEEINTEFYKLEYEIKSRKQILLKLVDEHFLNTCKQINENKLVLKNLQNENKYYAHLTESILNHNNSFDLMNLSEMILKKISSFKTHSSNIPKEAFESSIGLNLNWGESMNNCLLSIKSLGKVTSTPVMSLSEKLNVKHKMTNNIIQISIEPTHDDISKETSSSKMEVDNQIHNNSINDDDTDSSDYEPLLECSCCNQWSEELITCISCKRCYHNRCHIPVIPDCYPYTNYVSSTIKWKCTMCEDITKYCTVLNEKLFPLDISYNKIERKIIERILMELYCQNNDSEHFRDCPDKEIDPLYYTNIANPISLNDVKNRLDSDKPYLLFNDVIKDIKRIFSNAISYYHVSHPYHRSAVILKKYLTILLSKWIPNLETMHELQPING